MSFRVKIALYLFAACIILYFVYGNVIDTWAKVKAYYEFKNAVEENSYASRSVSDLENELKEYNKQLGYINSSQVSNQSRLLSHISEYSNQHKTRISLLPQNYSEEKNGYEIETNIVQMEGDYKEIVALLYDIERGVKISKVVSVVFEVKDDWTSKTKKMLATIYFQNIKVK